MDKLIVNGEELKPIECSWCECVMGFGNISHTTSDIVCRVCADLNKGD